jgi:hypothetical protein
VHVRTCFDPGHPVGWIVRREGKERVCSGRITNLVVVIGRENVKLEGDLRGRGLFTLTSILSPQGRGRSRKGAFLGRGLFTRMRRVAEVKV